MLFEMYHKIGESTTEKVEISGTMSLDKYYNVFSSTAWQGSSAPYEITISAITHGKGIHPTWMFYDNQVFDVNVDDSGNITVFSNTKKSMEIAIF